MAKEIKPRYGLCHIYATKNNTIIHVTDITGAETVARHSGGMYTSRGFQKTTTGTIYAAQAAAIDALSKGITHVHVKVRGKGGIKKRVPAPQAIRVIKLLVLNGLRIGRIEDVTPLPTDHIRPKGGRRGRRA